MEKITTLSTSRYSQEVIEPIVLDVKENTRRIFFAETNSAKLEEGETVSGTIVHQRKGKNDTWQDVTSTNLNTLKSGEGIKIRLDSKQTKRLFDGLTKLYNISKNGIVYGKNEYVISKVDEVLEVPENRKSFIKRLLENNHSEEVWKELTAQQPDLATRLAYARIYSARKSVLDEFERSLLSEDLESYWQSFFQKYSWIFGYGLKYKFLSMVVEQPCYGGKDVTGSGEEKGDFLLCSEAEEKFTILVEIKTPKTKIFTYNKNGICNKYRNGACLLSSDLVGAVAQIQVNCNTWERHAYDRENIETLAHRKIHTIGPGGILVIGDTKELDSQEKRQTFELFRGSLNGIEIITYDELFERARYIIHREECDDGVLKQEDNEEPPF